MTATLIVEDDKAYAQALARIVRAEGFDPEVATSGEEALAQLETLRPELVLVDLGLPGIDGLEVLNQVRRREPNAVCIVVTGAATVDNAVEVMRAGAFDILAKTSEPTEIRFRLRKALDMADLRRQVQYLRESDLRSEMIGASPQMRAVKARIAEVAATPSSTVLILGATGTGKELVARAIHNLSARKDRPLVSVNCAAVPDSLLESEFFGYERGAFTGAAHAKRGWLELANGGSLFLDELGDLDLQLQAKLLRVIEDRRFSRLGSVRETSVDVRFIAATNVDLHRRVSEGTFREDLLYRLNVFQIGLPPLHERGDDVLLLARHFVAEFNQQLKKRVTGIDRAVERALLAYSFPGNVRELRNMIEQAMILAKGQWLTEDLFRGLPTTTGVYAVVDPSVPGGGDDHAPVERLWGDLEARRRELDRAEAALLERAIGEADGNKSRAAERLGISRYALQRRLKRHGS